MALPPTIPTSFVPKQPVTTSPRKRTSGLNPFLMLSYIILGVAVFASLGVFGYSYYLDGLAKQKAEDVITAQNNIKEGNVTQFIRLRDRFTSGKEILNRHVGLSQFFDSLEALTLQGVRFNSLSLVVSEDRTAEVDMTGTARSFNALAAQSSSIASNKLIKRAIFSGINVSAKDNTVTFNLKADLDPALVQLTDTGMQASTVTVPVVATTTPVAPVVTTPPAATTPAQPATGTTTTP